MGRGVQNIYGQILVFFIILYYILYYVGLNLINNFAIFIDIWSCINDSLWQIRPTSAYTDLYIYRF